MEHILDIFEIRPFFGVPPTESIKTDFTEISPDITSAAILFRFRLPLFFIFETIQNCLFKAQKICPKVLVWFLLFDGVDVDAVFRDVVFVDLDDVFQDVNDAVRRHQVDADDVGAFDLESI